MDGPSLSGGMFLMTYPGKPKPRNAGGPWGDPQLPRKPGPGWITGSDFRVPLVGPYGSTPHLVQARNAGHAAWLRMVDRQSQRWRTHRKGAIE
jgi:hypothetical protein